MLKIENAEIGMKVLTKNNGSGEIIGFQLSDANRVYATITLDDGKIIVLPLDLTSKL